MHLEQIVHQSSTHKPEVGIGQIHDQSNDNLMIEYIGPSNANGKTDAGSIIVEWNNSSSQSVLDTQ